MELIFKNILCIIIENSINEYTVITILKKNRKVFTFSINF